MATTGMWAVKNRLDHLVNYVSNPYKTVGLETVIDYTTNNEKTIEKKYVTYLNCSFDNPKLSMVNTKSIFMMKVKYWHFMAISHLKKMKSMQIWHIS